MPRRPVSAAAHRLSSVMRSYAVSSASVSAMAHSASSSALRALKMKLAAGSGLAVRLLEARGGCKRGDAGGL